jgi:hypothetical protein
MIRPSVRPIGWIGPYGFKVDRSELYVVLGQKGLTQVLASLTVRQKVDHGRGKKFAFAPEVRRAYKAESGPLPVERGSTAPAKPASKSTYLILPVRCAAKFLSNKVISRLAIDSTMLAPPRVAEIGFDEEGLYSYQTAVIDHVFNTAFPAFDATAPPSFHRAYVQLAPGMGKTRCGLAIAARLGVPTLICVPTIGIAEQWRDEIVEVAPDARWAMYSNPSAAEVKRREAAKEGKKLRTPLRPLVGPDEFDFVIIVVNTLREKPPEFVAGYGLLIPR